MGVSPGMENGLTDKIVSFVVVCEVPRSVSSCDLVDGQPKGGVSVGNPALKVAFFDVHGVM